MIKKILSFLTILFFIVIIPGCSRKEPSTPPKVVPVTTRMIYSKIYTYAKAHKYTNNNVFAVIDFTLPSNQKRLFVYDSHTGKVVYSTYVTQGKGSGTGLYPKKFSNVPGSGASSLGVYNTKEYYEGHDGHVIRVNGLEAGYNSNAYNRYIEIHGASYIGNGNTGTSLGCFAVPKSEISKVLTILRPQTIIIAYYPDSVWLKNSKFING